MYKGQGTHAQSLQNEVRNVEIGRLGQVLRQQIFDRERILDDLCSSSRRSRRQGRDQEHLYHLKDKVSALCEQLNSCLGWNSSSPSAYYVEVSKGSTNKANLVNILRHMIGTNDINAARAAAGRRPSIAPLMKSGKSRMKPRKGISVQMYVMFEIAPTIAAGNDQKMTIAARNPWIANLLTILCHQLRFSADHTTSLGETPIKRGVM